MTQTLHTAPPSGLSTGESNTPAVSLRGESPIRVIKPNGEDPYRHITDKLHALLSRKRNYYGCGEDPLSNALGVEEDGIEPWRYQLARIGEKRRRLQGQLTKEDIIETLYDIAGHAAVAIATLARDSQPRQR